MQGPTQRWDQPPDPRESTVNMPRIDPSSLAEVSQPVAAALQQQNQRRGAAAMDHEG